MKAGDKIGPYEIRTQLGKGGMGEVYKAYDPSLDRCVAIKVLPPNLASEEGIKVRFHTEAMALAKVRHPNLVHIYMVGEHDGINYFAMEYIEGRTLASLLEAKHRLQVRKAFFVAGEVLAALYRVHETGLVHRDVKPGNIMIDRDGRVILMDLGLAKHDENVSVTKDGTILGTPQYISPEQAQGEHVDGRSDLYSLGVCLYEMVGGAPPFRGKSAFAVIRQHVETPPPPLDTRVQDLSPEAEYVIFHALEKDVDNRFQNAAEMAVAMNEVMRTKSLRSVIHSAEKKGDAPASPPKHPAARRSRTPVPVVTEEIARDSSRRRLQWIVIGGVYFMAILLTLAVVVALLRGPNKSTPSAGAGSEADVFPAEIVTKNGEKVRGEVLSYSGREGEKVLEVRLSDGSLVRFKLAEIARMRRTD